MKKSKKSPTTPDAEFIKQMITEAKSRIQGRQKVVKPSGTGQHQQPDIFEKQITSLEMELTGALKANAPKGKYIRDKLRHDGSRGDLASSYLSADLDNTRKALENILASENISEMGCAQIRSLAADLLNSGVNIGIAITRANNVFGKKIETQVPSEAGKKSGKSRQQKAEKDDTVIWQQVKPFVEPDRSAAEIIRRIHKAQGKQGITQTAEKRLRRILKEHMQPKKVLR